MSIVPNADGTSSEQVRLTQGGLPLGEQNRLPVSGGGGPFTDMVPIALGEVLEQPCQALGFVCTGEGTIAVVLASERPVSLPVAVGPSLQTLPLSAVSVAQAGTTATFAGLWAMVA